LIFFSTSSYPYSSDQIKKKEIEKVNYYYAKHLEKLRKSVKPRYIHLVDTRNYVKYNKIQKSGILFTIKNYQAKKVEFISSLDRFQPHSMVRNEKGVWFYVLPIEQYNEKLASREFLYKFVVDGLYMPDSTHSNYDDDGAGGLISKFAITDEMSNAREGIIVLGNDTPSGKNVLFRYYAPLSKFVSVIGSFNNWDSEIDIMKKNSEGYFELKKNLPPGKYTYLLRVDGQGVVDKNSPELKYHPVFEKVGFFTVK
jgi:hypothetical protein